MASRSTHRKSAENPDFSERPRRRRVRATPGFEPVRPHCPSRGNPGIDPTNMAAKKKTTTKEAATEPRVVEGDLREDDERFDRLFRPKTLGDFVGQDKHK